jgi:hypothetical protein
MDENVFVIKRLIIEVLPTPDSPINTTLHETALLSSSYIYFLNGKNYFKFVKNK